MKTLVVRLSIRGRIVLAVLLVLVVTATIGSWELYSIVATHQSISGERLPAEVVSTAVVQWLAIALTSAAAASAATAILWFATKMSGPRRAWAWVFTITLMWGLPRVGVLWPERERVLDGWIIHMGALYHYWPLFSVFPAVLLVHWFGSPRTENLVD